MSEAESDNTLSTHDLLKIRRQAKLRAISDSLGKDITTGTEEPLGQDEVMIGPITEADHNRQRHSKILAARRNGGRLESNITDLVKRAYNVGHREVRPPETKKKP